MFYSKFSKTKYLCMRINVHRFFLRIIIQINLVN
nr:MAG TPA: hypothetical protein [Caudoviricetes sp.]